MRTSYLSWNFLATHTESKEDIEAGLALVLGFRRFITYHITSAKAHMQTVMRSRTDHYCKVLARGERKEPSNTNVWYKRGIGPIGSRSDYGNAEVTRKAKGFWDSDSDDEAQAIEPVARGP